MSKPKVSRAEMDVLRQVMEHEPVSVRALADILHESKGLALTTVQTLMNRLVAKGYLRREQESGIWQYKLNVPRSDLELSIVDDFIESALGGSLSPLAAYLNERGNLSAEEAEKLNELIARIEKEDK